MTRRIAVFVVLTVVTVGLYAGAPYLACYVAEPMRARFWAPPRNTPDCGTTMPSLTRDQETAAQEIALADARLRQVLGSSAYAMESVASWTAGTCLIGAVPQFRLSEPPTITMDWPVLRWNGLDDRPVYPPSAWRATVIGLTDVYVSVDLERREVMQILPGGADRIVEPLTPGVLLRRLWRHLTYCPQ